MDDRENVLAAQEEEELRQRAAHRFFVTPFFESHAATMTTRVSACMSRQVATCQPDDTVYAAARTMLEAKVSALPVVADGKIVGILSLSDLLYRLETPHGTIGDALVEWLGGRKPEMQKHLALRVADAMTPDVVAIAPSDTVAAAAKRMIEHRVHQLPVVQGGQLEGIVRRRDLIGALVAWAEQAAGP